MNQDLSCSSWCIFLQQENYMHSWLPFLQSVLCHMTLGFGRFLRFVVFLLQCWVLCRNYIFSKIKGTSDSDHREQL